VAAIYSHAPSPPDACFSSRWRRIGPIAALLLLAPLISEVLFGATRLSAIFVLIPEVLTWGCGALLAREWVRRWNRGWPSLLSMGLALAVAEEWVIQQTSIAPLVGLARHTYGRVWGVNSVYLLWALGYESVWVVLIPVQLTELLFPERRAQCWLRSRGLVIASVVFVLGAVLAWYGWTQQARVSIFHLPPYSPPPWYLSGAAGCIVILILVARGLPSRAVVESGSSLPAPSVMVLVMTVLGAAWGAFVLLGYGSLPSIPFPFALAGGVALAAAALALARRWTSNPQWGDAHRFALVFGGTLGCVLGGFVVFGAGGALRIDWIGKLAFDVLAIAWLMVFRSRMTDSARTRVPR
jgi:hypothetical protein